MVKPYFEEDGIDISVRPVVDYRYETWPKEGIQAVTGTHRQAHEVGS